MAEEKASHIRIFIFSRTTFQFPPLFFLLMFSSFSSFSVFRSLFPLPSVFRAPLSSPSLYSPPLYYTPFLLLILALYLFCYLPFPSPSPTLHLKRLHFPLLSLPTPSSPPPRFFSPFFPSFVQSGNHYSRHISTANTFSFLLLASCFQSYSKFLFKLLFFFLSFLRFSDIPIGKLCKKEGERE